MKKNPARGSTPKPRPPNLRIPIEVDLEIGGIFLAMYGNGRKLSDGDKARRLVEIAIQRYQQDLDAGTSNVSFRVVNTCDMR